MSINRSVSNFGLAALAASKGYSGWAIRFVQPMLKRNDASAQWYAGLLHHHGYGVRQDSALAREWYEKSVAGGFSLAEAGLADLDASKLDPRGPGNEPTTVLSFYRARYAPDKLI